MLGVGKTGRVHASTAASPDCSQDIYQRYAAALYRQALLTADDPVLAEPAACDVIVNKRALAAMPHGEEDDARYRLAQSVLRRRPQRGTLGPVLCGGLGYIRASAVLGIQPREMMALLRAVLRKRASSPAVQDGDHV